MDTADIKKNLSKVVYYRVSMNSEPSPYILSAYIYRVDPKDVRKRLHQAELIDTGNSRTRLIVRLDDIIVQ